MKLASAPALLIAFATLATGVIAQDNNVYIDDRSSAEAVVTSFYNAINGGEFARAYSYFATGEEPSDYASFAAGYAQTRHVELTTGTPASEGAAGSTYYTLPVAIDATDSAGKHAAFAGCYTLRLISPQLQEPPFRPLHIVKGELHEVTGGAKAEPPATCGP